MDYTSKTLGEITNARLKELTGPELVELYNELVEINHDEPKPIKKFSDRGAGIRRVKGELEAWVKAVRLGEIKPEKTEPATEPKGKSKKSKAKAEPKEKEELPLLDLPMAEEVKHHRKGTRRGKIIALMEREEGATAEEMMKVADWDARTLRITLKLINANIGYGIHEVERGRFVVEGPVKGRKPFDLPFSGEEPKQYRPGTKRAQTIDLLSRPEGATVEEVMEATGWPYATALEGIKLVHTYVGYGLREDDDSRIYLTTDKEG